MRDHSDLTSGAVVLSRPGFRRCDVSYPPRGGSGVIRCGPAGGGTWHVLLRAAAERLGDGVAGVWSARSAVAVINLPGGLTN